MKIVRVQYTVRSSFVEQDKKNISAVIAQVRSAHGPGDLA
jgi:hypothetical protein